jgi:hypothetical protein
MISNRHFNQIVQYRPKAVANRLARRPQRFAKAKQARGPIDGGA